MRIAVDALGGDFAPAATVEGAVLAASEGVPITLVGPPDVVASEMRRLGGAPSGLEIAEAPAAVAMSDPNPAATVRARSDVTISRCMILARQGEADAVVTMGHTGAGLAAALLRLGRLPGVRRPGLASPFPTVGGRCVLIDVGANVDVKGAYLYQFAVMGAAYAEGVMGLKRPRVGLLSVGEEEGKGTDAVQEAYELLTASSLNFVGNVEGRDVPAGAVDVAVVDGFTGNILVKFAEGIAPLVESILREATADTRGRLGGLLLRPGLRRARGRMDYRAYGGAALLGVRGMVVIGHGRSDAVAVRAAIDVAAKGVTHDVPGAIAAGVAGAPATLPAGPEASTPTGAA